MDNREIRIFGTGHRPDRLCGGLSYEEWEKSESANMVRNFFRHAVVGMIENVVNEVLDGAQFQPVVCASGLVPGAEIVFGEVFCDLKIPLYDLFLSKTGFTGEKWLEYKQSLAKFQRLIDNAREVHTVCDFKWFVGSSATKWADKGSPGLLLAVWDGKEGGRTHNTILRAKKLGIETWYFHPQTFEISRFQRDPMRAI